MCVISAYTRKQALEDGVLVDASELAYEAGLVYSTAVTAAVWERYVRVPKDVPWQDEEGRLWDILWMLRMRLRRHDRHDLQVFFRLHVCNAEQKEDLVTLKAVCGPGDEGEPVITIMLPNED